MRDVGHASTVGEEAMNDKRVYKYSRCSWKDNNRSATVGRQRIAALGELMG